MKRNFKKSLKIFVGNCTPSAFPEIDFQAIEDLELISPSTINIWMWVVLSFNFIWLLSSLTLIMSKISIALFSLINFHQ